MNKQERLRQGNKRAEKILKYRERHWYNYHFSLEEWNRIRGILRKTRAVCSCWMCGHRRKNEGVPIREIRQTEDPSCY